MNRKRCDLEIASFFCNYVDEIGKGFNVVSTIHFTSG